MIQQGRTGRYRHKRDDGVGNNLMARLREVEAFVEVGLFLRLQIGNWSAGMNAAQHIAHGHNGCLVRLATGYMLPINPCLMMGCNLFTTYADNDYMAACCSVDADNAARSGLRRYNASLRFEDVGGMRTAQYAPWKKCGIMGIVGYTRLIGDAKNSPVLDYEEDHRQHFGGLMATYEF